MGVRAGYPKNIHLVKPEARGHSGLKIYLDFNNPRCIWNSVPSGSNKFHPTDDSQGVGVFGLARGINDLSGFNHIGWFGKTDRTISIFQANPTNTADPPIPINKQPEGFYALDMTGANNPRYVRFQTATHGFDPDHPGRHTVAMWFKLAQAAPGSLGTLWSSTQGRWCIKQLPDAHPDNSGYGQVAVDYHGASAVYHFSTGSWVYLQAEVRKDHPRKGVPNTNNTPRDCTIFLYTSDKNNSVTKLFSLKRMATGSYDTTTPVAGQIYGIGAEGNTWSNDETDFFSGSVATFQLWDGEMEHPYSGSNEGKGNSDANTWNPSSASYHDIYASGAPYSIGTRQHQRIQIFNSLAGRFGYPEQLGDSWVTPMKSGSFQRGGQNIANSGSRWI